MKKFLIAVAAGLVILGSQVDVEASEVKDLNKPAIEMQEVGSWTHFRDKHLLGRETENERRDREERERRHWERRHNYNNNYHRNPPPPRRR